MTQLQLQLHQAKQADRARATALLSQIIRNHNIPQVSSTQIGKQNNG